MKFLSTQSELVQEFRRLCKRYNEYYWATAWASINSTPFDDLLLYSAKIKKIIVGIHFYQTHPDFIETFLRNDIRYVLQPEGTFHPKFYLFQNNEQEWELLIGSANFTNSAFTKNMEGTILVSQNDVNSIDTYQKAVQFINDAWKEARLFSKVQLEKYRITWNNHRSKIKSLSGQYGGSSKKSKPIHEVPAVNMTWEEFMARIRNETKYGAAPRLMVIDKCRQLFNTVDHFNELSEDERKFIAGIPNKLTTTIDWGLFGSMKGAGKYKNRIIENDAHISKALDQIPLSGQITKIHFDNFFENYQKALPGNFIATATRLLCMKRPDTFICFDSKNRSELCQAFGIIQTEMNYERYWQDIILRIYDSEWWLNPHPRSPQEEKISNARAAFLDSLYYEE